MSGRPNTARIVWCHKGLSVTTQRCTRARQHRPHLPLDKPRPFGACQRDLEDRCAQGRPWVLVRRAMMSYRQTVVATHVLSVDHCRFASMTLQTLGLEVGVQLSQTHISSLWGANRDAVRGWVRLATTATVPAYAVFNATAGTYRRRPRAKRTSYNANSCTFHNKGHVCTWPQRACTGSAYRLCTLHAAAFLSNWTSNHPSKHAAHCRAVGQPAGSASTRLASPVLLSEDGP